MQHAENNDARTDDLIEDLEGKAAQEYPPELAVIQALTFRLLCQFTQRAGNLVQKFIAQPGPSLLIPVTARRQIRLGGGADQHQAFQGGGRRNRASTADQGVTAPGSAS